MSVQILILHLPKYGITKWLVDTEITDTVPHGQVIMKKRGSSNLSRPPDEFLSYDSW